MKNAQILLLLALVSRTFCLDAQISNHGDFKTIAGTNILFTQAYVNNGNHNSDGNLYLQNNFINNGLTTASSGTTFFKSVINDVIQISGTTSSVNFYNLEVDLTSASAKGVSVEDNMVVNLENSLYLRNGDLRLVGETQLVQTHVGANVNISGAGKLLKDQQGDNSVYKYNYWSSPVSQSGAFTLSGCMFDGTDSSINPFDPQSINYNNGPPYNGAPSVTDGGGNVTVPLAINKYWLYTYAMGNGSYADWLSIDENTTLSPGQGYTLKGTGTVMPAQNYVFYGEPNSGDYNFNINNGESALLGNPYPSALDAIQFLTDNSSVVDALYFWVDGGSNSHYLTDYLGGYAIRNLTGGVPPSVASSLISGVGTSGSVTPPSPFIALGQGFFVQASSTGNIQFRNAQRIYKTESALETTFYRNPENLENPNKYIRIGYEDPEGFHRQLLLGFLPNTSADDNYNRAYDATINNPREDDMYFILEDEPTQLYAIQGVGDYDIQKEFDLGITVAESGIHKIMLDSLENFNDSVYLIDHYTNSDIDLTATDYEFTIPIGDYTDRYTIAFQPLYNLSVEESNLSNLNIFYNGTDAILIKNTDHININKIMVYNNLGQRVLTKDSGLGTQDNIVIPFAQKSGVYILTLSADNTTKSTKILIY